MIGAVIYIRASPKEQVGNPISPTQLRTCEAYCRREGYEVLERFTEETESAKTSERPELQRLLKHCGAHKGHVHFVVVFNLARFARDKYDHVALRSHLRLLGISLRSATDPIEDASTGTLVDGVLASFARLDHGVRSDRTRTRMKAALERGQWTFLAPIGYINVPKSFGTSLIPDPERGAAVRRIFEDFATGRFSQRELLAEVTRQGVRTSKGQPISARAFSAMLQNRLYIGIVDVPDYGVCGTRGDFEPLISEQLFDRVQAVLAGRVRSTARLHGHRPDFPLRGFVRCAECGGGVSGRWSHDRSGREAYYNCRPPCRAVNMASANLEGLFVDELDRFQPTPGYVRLLEDTVLGVWQARKATVRARVDDAERQVRAIQQQLDRLDDAFVVTRSLDSVSYERQRDRLREALTLVHIDRYDSQLEEFDVDGIMAFAERVLPRASTLWVQSTPDQRQRLQRLFFPEGVVFNGKRFDRTAATTSISKYLRPVDGQDDRLWDFRQIRGQDSSRIGHPGSTP